MDEQEGRPPSACTMGVDGTPEGECGKAGTWTVTVAVHGGPGFGPIWRCDEHIAWCLQFHVELASTTMVHAERVP